MAKPIAGFLKHPQSASLELESVILGVVTANQRRIRARVANAGLLRPGRPHDHSGGRVLRKPVTRSPGFHWVRPLRMATRSKRLRTLRLAPVDPEARRLLCCDIKSDVLLAAMEDPRMDQLQPASPWL